MALPRNKHRGYVYIFTNECYSNMIKIGRTTRDPRIRARELSTTGVPAPYCVSFYMHSDDCRKLEKEVHKRLEKHRYKGNREFFKYPLQDCIHLIRDLDESISPQIRIESIYHRFCDKYESYIHSKIADLRIVQSKEHVWLEVTEEHRGEYGTHQTIERTDLIILAEDPTDLSTPGASRFFKIEDPISENARKFIEDLPAITIYNSFDIFASQVYPEIERAFIKETCGNC